jgi:hypothetical protein
VVAGVPCLSVQQYPRLLPVEQGPQPVGFGGREFIKTEQPEDVFPSGPFQAGFQLPEIGRGAVRAVFRGELPAPGVPQGMQDKGFLLQCRREGVGAVALPQTVAEVLQPVGHGDVITGEFPVQRE